MKTLGKSIWPKVPLELSAEQRNAREQFMHLWHEILPKKYSTIEKFNHDYPAGLALRGGTKTLEVGAGLGEHATFEDLSKQDYYSLEYREEFCKELRKKMAPEKVVCGDIQVRQPWDDAAFDRVIAIHVLEHLRDLPAALKEIQRLMKSDAIFDVVIPTEGGLAYSLARKISASGQSFEW